jgi:DNA-binding SARP family transcriptional activator
MLLRGFQLVSGGRQVDLPVGSQRLVAFLAIHRRVLSRTYVAGNLWTDQSEEHANASLRTALWRLRRHGFRLIESTRSHLQLSPSVTVDLYEMEALAKQVLRHEQLPSPKPLDPLLFEAELLGDWYDDWVMLERERFRQTRLYALETLCEDLAKAGSYALAVEAGLASVAAEPLRESAHRALIKAHFAAGNLNDAIRQYRLYRRLLSDQLGLEPSAEMERVIGSLNSKSDGAVTTRQ